MKSSITGWIEKGADIAGAGLGPLLTSTYGDISGGLLTQFGVLLTKEIADCMEQQYSEREQQRSAAALIIAFKKIQKRLDDGDGLRDDEFFRTKAGQPVSAQIVIKGVLTIARDQYEERKALLLGNLLANASFDDALSADDLSWMIKTIDSLTYRHLLILAHFCSSTPSGWNSNNIWQIHKRNPVVLTQIEELRSLLLLSGRSTVTVEIETTPAGRLLVGCTDLLEELKWYGEEIKSTISFPANPVPIKV